MPCTINSIDKSTNLTAFFGQVLGGPLHTKETINFSILGSDLSTGTMLSSDWLLVKPMGGFVATE